MYVLKVIINRSKAGIYTFNYLRYLSSKMGLINKAFFKLGYTAASNPGTCCFFAFMLTIVCGLGFINFRLTVSYFNLLKRIIE